MVRIPVNHKHRPTSFLAASHGGWPKAGCGHDWLAGLDTTVSHWAAQSSIFSCKKNQNQHHLWVGGGGAKGVGGGANGAGGGAKPQVCPNLPSNRSGRERRPEEVTVGGARATPGVPLRRGGEWRRGGGERAGGSPARGGPLRAQPPPPPASCQWPPEGAASPPPTAPVRPGPR